MKETAGTLLYRHTKEGVEVLLVHPSGNYNKRSPWSIPKGLPDPGEPLEKAARRETLEETGIVAEHLQPLGSVEYTKSRKRVYCFTGPAPEYASPTCASWEVDKAEFVLLDEARKQIHPDQAAFLARLEHFLEKLERKSK
jgi:predicted NUDIX family NTP pyrophosphohydrolase